VERDNVAARREYHVDRPSPPAIVLDEDNASFDAPDFHIVLPEHPLHPNGTESPSTEKDETNRQSVQVFPAPEFHTPKSDEQDAATAPRRMIAMKDI